MGVEEGVQGGVARCVDDARSLGCIDGSCGIDIPIGVCSCVVVEGIIVAWVEG